MLGRWMKKIPIIHNGYSHEEKILDDRVSD